jgi:hypothetical protein
MMSGGFGAQFGKQSLRPNEKLQRESLAISRDLVKSTFKLTLTHFVRLRCPKITSPRC